jgi:hypothetical protein
MAAVSNWQRPRDANGHFLAADPINPKRKKKKAKAAAPQNPPIPPINVNVTVNPQAPAGTPVASARVLTGLRQKVTLIVDKSGSMGGFRREVPRSVNDTIATLKRESRERGIETIFGLVLFDTHERWICRDTPIERAPDLTEWQYLPGGGTALRDTLAQVIDAYRKGPDARDPQTAFYAHVTTDGLDENSHLWSNFALRELITEVQGTDRWTIGIQCPPNMSQRIINEYGLPPGNVMEWAQNRQGFDHARVSTQSAVGTLYAARSAGETRSCALFANVAAPSVVEATLQEVTHQYRQFEVRSGEHGELADFIRGKNLVYELGRAFYELVKPEKVQGRKEVVLGDKLAAAGTTEKLFTGAEARRLIGLPDSDEEVWLKPGDQGRYRIYIQSTSTNRGIGLGSRVLYRT